MSTIIALLTDFGTEDIYVAAMKAAMLRICPSARIVDITHAIQPQNVREAAFALFNSYHHFPAGTIFCVVVDPGVGSDRLAIAVRSRHYRFVAPDNGVLSYALERRGTAFDAVKLEDKRFRLATVSYTFHGRDVFAPAAAHLAEKPETFDSLGGALDDIVRLPPPELTFARQRLSGEALHIDHFGNIVTSIGALRWASESELKLEAVWSQDIPSLHLAAANANITIHSHTVQGISHAYHEVAPGEIMALVDSNGFLEIGANQDDAAARLDVQPGDKVMLRLA